MSAEFEKKERRQTLWETVYPAEFPAIHAEVFRTEQGTLYLKDPGVVLLAGPAVNISGMKEFLQGFPQDYSEYLADPDVPSPAELLVKTAGQVCYASWGSQRTRNKDVERYLDNLISSGHGSVLEHANFSLLFYGVSRVFTHELVRHRAGMGYSQLSQRYVSGRILRFVERLEYQHSEELHQNFVERIDRARQEHGQLVEKLTALQDAGYLMLYAEQKTDKRKKVQQAARSPLPEETEAPIVATGNIRAWRHVISMRASPHAETEIRRPIFAAFEVLHQVAPVLFYDFKVLDLPDGTKAVEARYPKV